MPVEVGMLTLRIVNYTYVFRFQPSPLHTYARRNLKAKKSFRDVRAIAVGCVKIGKSSFKSEGLVLNGSSLFFFSLPLLETVWKEIWI